ncbi:hypothetical protein [Zymobacter sp. IVIA_12111.31 C1]|uniref:hypothetical protein n=1 Tax=Zymobacter sp. IVIA_12111.31 C1 TaxID=3394854 RepID=UPI0039C2B362
MLNGSALVVAKKRETVVDDDALCWSAVWHEPCMLNRLPASDNARSQVHYASRIILLVTLDQYALCDGVACFRARLVCNKTVACVTNNATWHAKMFYHARLRNS